WGRCATPAGSRRPLVAVEEAPAWRSSNRNVTRSYPPSARSPPPPVNVTENGALDGRSGARRHTARRESAVTWRPSQVLDGQEGRRPVDKLTHLKLTHLKRMAFVAVAALA